MNKRRQGMSRRQYGKHAGTSAAYVSKLIAKGKLPVLPDGSLNAAACDLARAANTNMYRGERRRQRQAAREGEPTGARNSFPDCLACGESYSVIDAKACGSPNVERFCSGQCAFDAAAGLSVSQVRRKIARESRGG
jgi:hypothetical protein